MTSTTAQLCLLGVVGGAITLFLLKKSPQENASRIVARKSSSVQVNTVAAQLPTSAADQTADFVDTQETNLASEEVETTATATPTTPQASPPATTKTTEARAPAKVEAPHLVVYYAEVSRGSLGGIISASRSTGQFMSFSDYSAGILPSLDKALGAPQVKVLHREQRPLESAKTLQWFYGLKDRQNPSVEIGMITFFELNDIEASNLRGNIEIQRTWKEEVSPNTFEIQRKSFPAIFEINNDTGFFISGVMPRQSHLENDSELTAIDIYKILNSPAFRSGESEFVIFIGFDKGN
ncbi:MAG: hypothetical protein AAGB31_07280 [Bdellovibrio sp.]